MFIILIRKNELINTVFIVFMRWAHTIKSMSIKSFLYSIFYFYSYTMIICTFVFRFLIHTNVLVVFFRRSVEYSFSPRKLHCSFKFQWNIFKVLRPKIDYIVNFIYEFWLIQTFEFHFATILLTNYT